MLCLINIESIFYKYRSYSLGLGGISTDCYKAINLSKDLYILFPYFLIFSELLEEVSDKETHLFFDLTLDVLEIDDQFSG